MSAALWLWGNDGPRRPVQGNLPKPFSFCTRFSWELFEYAWAGQMAGVKLRGAIITLDYEGKERQLCLPPK